MGRSRGFALIYLLFVVAIVLILVSNLVWTTKNQLFTVTSSVQRTKALYAAEAGLAHALAELEKDAGWIAGFDNHPMPLGTGTYSLRFAATPGSATNQESVNNLRGSATNSSYHGADTLPPYSALLIVNGEVGGVQRTVEALVVLGGDLPDRTALLATDRVTVAGEATIDGRVSLTDPTSIPVDIHSNSEASGPLLDLGGVSFSGSEFLSGQATTSGSSAASISVVAPAAGGISGGVGSQLPPKKLPQPNIEALLNDHVAHPGPPIPAVPGPVSMAGLNYYVGDVVINGDLTLENDARLFVRGSLTVRGSVTGTGSLVVGENATLHGTADVTPGEGDYVSVLSGGHVILSGFRGHEYMEALAAADPLAAQDWQDLKFAYEKKDELLVYSGPYDEQQISGFLTDVTRNERIDALQSIVTNHPWAERHNLRDRNHRTQNGTTENYSGRRNRTADRLRQRYFTSAPEGSTEAFLDQKLLNVSDLFRDMAYDRAGNRLFPEGADPGAYLYSYDDWNPATQGGFFDAHSSYNFANSALRREQMREAIAAVAQLDYERLGAAEFKGVIYCEGALVVNNDINVMGAILANGNESLEPLTLDDETYRPGEIALLGSTKLTYVEEMVEEGIQNLQGVGTVDVKSWVARP